MADKPRSGFREYVPTGEWRAGTLLVLTVAFAAAFAVAGWWYQRELLDDVLSAFGRFGAGFGAVVALSTVATWTARWSHCRSPRVAWRAGSVIGGAFWVATWAAALAAARDALPDEPEPTWFDLIAARWDLRAVPWLVWPLEAFMYVVVAGGAADNAAEEPYCDDVGRWARTTRLGVAREVDAQAIRGAAGDGSLPGLFAAAAAKGGAARVRFDLLTVPGSHRQFLRVTLLRAKRKNESDDDDGEKIVGAAVLTGDERRALEAVFAPAA